MITSSQNVGRALPSPPEDGPASFFTHLFVALVAVRILAPGARWPFYLAAAALSVIPDADAALHHSGVPYEHPFGHRGFTHSLLFAAVGATVAALLLRNRSRRAWTILFAIGATHGVLDAMTTGGLGVAFFFPDTTRIFLPLRPILVGPISIRAFFSDWGLRVIVSELLVVWLPLGAILALVELYRRRYAKQREGERRE